ncbi:MAG TPA: PEP-CTERM sorting domain-containing protein [Longimicrobiales bacterium]
MKLKLSRNKKIAITAGAVAIAALLIFSESREQAVGKGRTVKFERVITPPETVATRIRRDLPRPKARPTLRAREGWPFEQLPMIAKLEMPVARVVPVTITPPPYITLAPATVPDSVLAAPVAPPLWLVPVGAGGLGFGGGSTTYDSRVPEPATLLLVSGGLALIGLRGLRRKGG